LCNLIQLYQLSTQHNDPMKCLTLWFNLITKLSDNPILITKQNILITENILLKYNVTRRGAFLGLKNVIKKSKCPIWSISLQNLYLYIIILLLNLLIVSFNVLCIHSTCKHPMKFKDLNCYLKVGFWFPSLLI
jgi:hypothetical protein